jgi:hypothetical protein
MDDLSRRQFLADTMAAGGLWLSSGLAAEAARKGKRCILLWMTGGPSHIDTFDMKPEAPIEIRGLFKPIDTNVNGIQICEHLPQLARQADKLAIVRSMRTLFSDHLLATYYLLTGRRLELDFTHPELGVVVGRQGVEDDLPGFISLGAPPLGRPGEGLLGPSSQPLRLKSFRAAPGPRLSKLCDIDREPDRVRQRYGNSDFGRNCLAARRLLEAGVPFVEVLHEGYDLHAKLFELLPRRLAELDPAWSALLQDLDDRGLLQDTLVVWMGEFGRMPRINPLGGRDHWAQGWSVVLAGGGVKSGLVHGKTDRTGSSVDGDVVTERDLLATIATALGLDPRAELRLGKETVSVFPAGAEPIKELLR